MTADGSILGNLNNSGIYQFTVFLDEPANTGVRQVIWYRFRRPAKPHALRRHYDRPVYQDRVREYPVDELFGGPFRIV